MKFADAVKKHAQAKAARGAKYLDRRRPKWFNEISIKRLDITCRFNCIIGQLFGEYCKGAQYYGLKWTNAVRLGFEEDWSSSSDRQQAWIEEIKKRRLRARKSNTRRTRTVRR